MYVHMCMRTYIVINTTLALKKYSHMSYVNFINNWNCSGFTSVITFCLQIEMSLININQMQTQKG